MKIKVSLIGTPKVKIDGTEISFPYKRAEGLFYYLCVKSSVTRDELINVFWADSSEETARKNLRDAIYHIKKALGFDVIYTSGNSKIFLMTDNFEPIDILCINDNNIVEKYTDDFLGYFYIKNCLEFEDWIYEVRRDMSMQFERAVLKRAEESRLKKDKRTLVKLGYALATRKNDNEAVIREILSDLRECKAYDEASELARQYSESILIDSEDVLEDETLDLIEKIRSEKNNYSETDRENISQFFLREKEMLAIMEELYVFNTDSSARSLIFEGESGVGKTAILENLMRGRFLDQYSVVSYRCVEDEKDLFLKPWKDIINALALNNGWEDELVFYDRTLQLETEEDEYIYDAQYELYAESIIEKLFHDGEINKAVLIIDDIHWMDKASLRLLKNLILWSKNSRILMIMTMRSEEEDRIKDMVKSLEERGLIREVQVNCFSAEEVGIIIRDIDAEILKDAADLNEIYKNTGGNALFFFEYIREIKHGGSLSGSKKITDAIQSRLSGLSDEEMRILKYISLMPRFATTEELKAMDDGEDPSETMDKLLSKQILKWERTYNKEGLGFPHQIIKDHVYRSIPDEEKRRLHLKLAKYYEELYAETKDAGLFPLLIHNFKECGDSFSYYKYQLEYLGMFYSVEHEIYPTVLYASRSAIMPQLESGDQLVSLVEKIRELHREYPEAAELRMRAEFLIGRYDLFSGSLKKGIENIHTSISLAKGLHDNKCLLDNYLQMIYYAIQVGNLDLFDDYLASCENLIEKGDASEADVTTVKRLRGLYCMKTDDNCTAKGIFAEVIQSTKDLHKNDPAYQIGLAACYNYLGEICEKEEDLDNALKNYSLAIRNLEQSEMMSTKGAVIYTNIGYLLYRLGRNAQAKIYISKGIRCFEENNGIWGRSKAYSLAALLAAENEHWDEAEERYEEAKLNAIKDENPDSMKMITEIEKLFVEHRSKEEEKNESSNIRTT